MPKLWTAAALLGVAMAGASPAIAQAQDTQDPRVLPAATVPLVERSVIAPELETPDDAIRRRAQLDAWVADFLDWKAWMAQWGGRREPGWFTESRTRRPRPDPPVWLFDRCNDSLPESGDLANACTLLAEWSVDYATAQALAAPATISSGDEDTGKITWWEHLHLDVGWPALQTGIYGVVGTHASTNVGGRLEVFVAPGAMLLNIPTRNGARAWKLAANYGIGYRLGEFRFPGNKHALLHVNLAKAWLLAAGPDVSTKSTDFVGFSITFKKTP
jgi:hypothetical protein